MAAPLHAPSTGRDRVLDAAAERFLRQGYAATTLRQIAADVGIQAGSIYHHFASKEELFAAVLGEGIDVMIEAFEVVESHAEPLDDPRDRLAAHVRAHLGALFEHGPYTANHVTAFFTAPPEVRIEIVPHRDAYEARWTALLDELVAGGSIRPGLDTGMLRLTLFGAMNWSIEWFDASRGNLDGFAEGIVDQFWNGVAA